MRYKPIEEPKVCPAAKKPENIMKNEENTLQWFAMSAPYRRELKAQDFLTAKGVECFVAMKKAVIEKNGCKRHQTVPAIHNLIFVHTTKERIQSIKQCCEYLQYMTRPVDGKNTPITIPEKEMQQFIAVTQARIDEITYLQPQELNLEKGTKVRIHGGPFDGTEGVFVKIKGKRNRRLVVLIEGLAAVAVNTEITPDLVEVL